MLLAFKVMVSNWFAFVMLMLTGFLLCASSFKCYQCRSDLDDNCEDLQDDEYLLDCDKKAKQNGSDEFDEDDEEIAKAPSVPKPLCRKVMQYLYFINKSTVVITSRECTKTLTDIREDKCHKENFVQFYLYFCECSKQGCNAAGDRRTRFWSILFFSLGFYVVFHP